MLFDATGDLPQDHLGIIVEVHRLQERLASDVPGSAIDLAAVAFGIEKIHADGVTVRYDHVKVHAALPKALVIGSHIGQRGAAKGDLLNDMGLVSHVAPCRQE